jgi:acyl-CoA thioester hydrolase
MSTIEPSIFRHRIRVYMEDTDMGGVVYYANYIKFFERARTEWLRSRGINQRVLFEQENGHFIIGDTNVRFVKPARLEQDLDITVVITELGRASLVIAQQAWSDQELIAESSIRVIWVVAGTLKPSRFPQDVFDRLSER